MRPSSLPSLISSPIVLHRKLLLLPLALVLLLSFAPSATRAQIGELSLFRDDGFVTPYSYALGESFTAPDRVCAILVLDTRDAPYPCYNVTIRNIHLCSGTRQNLRPCDPGDPNNTGCNTPIGSGVVIDNILYDVDDPSSAMAIYDPQLEVIPTFESDTFKFCYNTQAISPYNNILSVEYNYTAVSCASGAECESVGDVGCNSCEIGCDGVPCSDAIIDPCGLCVTPTPADVQFITLTGIIRDFKAAGTPGGHPDFEYIVATDKNITTLLIGPDSKPVYGTHPNGTVSTHNATRFNQWWNNVTGVNLATPFTLTLTKTPSGTFSYTNFSFFPIDGQLFGNQGNPHNYHFTLEIHLRFTYRGGEVFNFIGDDDVWVYINGRRVIDLGGVHTAQNASVDLDAVAASIGISVGNDYNFDFFYCERHTTQADLKIETSILLYTCSCFDVCGVCGGNNSTCSGCDGVPFSGKLEDACGVCDGDGSSCATTPPPPTTAAPATTTPAPTTTAPPTTTPVPTTTAPPTTTPAPITTAPPTTSPAPSATLSPAPPPPTSGQNISCAPYMVACPDQKSYLAYDIGCVDVKRHEQSRVELILGGVTIFLLVCMMLALSMWFAAPRRRLRVVQDIQIRRRRFDDTGTAPLLLVALVGLLALCGTAEAQTGTLSLFRDDNFATQYSYALDMPFVAPNRVCGTFRLDTTGAPFPFYNLTITRMTLCVGTMQNVEPCDHNDPLNTGCNTPLESGVLLHNVIYDLDDPSAALSIYAPMLEIIPTSDPTAFKFCYKTDALSPFNNLIVVDFNYTASATTAPVATTTTPTPTAATPEPSTSGSNSSCAVYLVACPHGKNYLAYGVGCVDLKKIGDNTVELILAAVTLLLLLCMLLSLSAWWVVPSPQTTVVQEVNVRKKKRFDEEDGVPLAVASPIAAEWEKNVKRN